MTFSHKLGLYDVQGAIPLIKKVMVPAEPDARISVDLEDAMPLLSFLAPVSISFIFEKKLESHGS